MCRLYLPASTWDHRPKPIEIGPSGFCFDDDPHERVDIGARLSDNGALNDIHRGKPFRRPHARVEGQTVSVSGTSWRPRECALPSA